MTPLSVFYTMKRTIVCLVKLLVIVTSKYDGRARFFFTKRYHGVEMLYWVVLNQNRIQVVREQL